MKYEKIYATQQQFTAAEGNSGNVTSIKPGVAFIEERKKTGFNKPHDTMIITYEVDDTGTTKIFHNTAITTNLDEVFINKVKVPVSSITSEYDFGGPGTYKVLYRYTSLTSMPASGFMGCVSIKTVVLPKSVSGNMPTLLFADCTKLSNIRIRGNVTAFNTYVFRNCTSLKVFRIPPSLTSISSFSFFGCTNISKVYVENWNAYLHMNDPQNVRDYPLRHSTGGTIFVNGKELITLDIPDNITFIPHYAFANCLSLRQVNGLNNVTDIGVGAFKGCKNLISIGENISGLTTIRNEVFSGCTSLVNIGETSGITSVGQNAFNGCRNLTGDLAFPILTSIGSNAFLGCTKISSLTIPINVNAGMVANCAQNGSIRIYGNLSGTAYTYIVAKTISIGGDVTNNQTLFIFNTDYVEEIRIGGNMSINAGRPLTATTASQSLKFFELMGTYTGKKLDQGNERNYFADNAIMHLGYNGIAATPEQVIARSDKLVKIYVGDGSSQAHDQAILNQYLEDSSWATYSTKLDTWYNYNGPYKS